MTAPSGWQQHAQQQAPRSGAGDAPARLNGGRLLLRFAIVLVAILLIAGVGAFLANAPEPPPDCQPGTECGGPPPAGAVQPTASSATAAAPGTGTTAAPNAIGIRAGTQLINGDLGFEFEYSDWWEVDNSNTTPGEVDLVYQGTSGEALLVVAAIPTTAATPQAFADQWFAKLQDWAPDLAIDDSPQNAILGPEIGYIDGVGRTYAGSRSSAQSATTPVGIGVVTATDGYTTAAVIVIVMNPDKEVGSVWLQYNVRRRAEIVLKTFHWGVTS